MHAIRSLLRTPQVAQNAVQIRNMSGIAIPVRQKVSKGEMITLGMAMVVGWFAIPAYVLVNMKHYRGEK